MACRLDGAKPLSEPMLHTVLLIGPLGTNFNEILIGIQSFKHFHSRKFTWKCRLGNAVHFVSASISMCYWFVIEQTIPGIVHSYDFWIHCRQWKTDHIDCTRMLSWGFQIQIQNQFIQLSLACNIFLWNECQFPHGAPHSKTIMFLHLPNSEKKDEYTKGNVHSRLHSQLTGTKPLRSRFVLPHYTDVIMGAMGSQITSLTIVYSAVFSGADQRKGTDQRKHQSSASLAFLRGIHRWQVNSPHKGPVTRKMFPFDDVIMNQ